MNDLVLTTTRLTLDRFTIDDAPFIYTLVNEPAFKRYIGDRAVNSLDDARRYLEDGPLAQYAAHDYGFYRVTLTGAADAIGMCGLVVRPEFAQPDLGFAFLETSWGAGYALEAARAVLDEGQSRLAMGEVLAYVNDDNARSVKLLRKLGFEDDGRVVMPGETESIQRLRLTFA